MKKKQGFTLIELLAVIIILAVIALIATPIILNIIERARISAAEASAKGYAEAVNYVIIDKNFVNQGDYDGTYDVIENVLGASYDGQGPSKGHYVVEKNRVKSGEFCINGYPIKYEDGYGKYDPENTICETGSSEPKEPELITAQAHKVCANEITYDEVDIFTIEKVEDLVCISILTKEGNTFEERIVKLLNNIDITNNENYIDASTKFYNDEDINENGTSEDIKTELTTWRGFYPIGNNSTHFNGTFDGNGYTISNIMINASLGSSSTVIGVSGLGLFGVSYGTIKNLNIEEFNITGAASLNTGGLAGVSSGTIENINATRITVAGPSTAGAIVGYLGTGKIEGINMNDITVTADNTGGGLAGVSNGTIENINAVEVTVKSSQYAGGIIGQQYDAILKNVNIDTVTAKSNSTYAVIGGIAGTNSGDILGINVKNAIIEGNNYVGGIVGRTAKIVKEITFEGTITGHDYVGAIAGHNNNATITNVLVRNVKITGNNYVGGISGGGNDNNGIIESGTITGTGTNVSKIVGDSVGSGYSTSSVIVNGPSNRNPNDGTDFPTTNINNLSYYSTLLYNGKPIIETAETGDVDGSGFYFGYGSDGKIRVVKAQ